MCCIVIRFVNISAYRILGVFPTPSISHQVVFRPLMRALAEKGHDVYVMTPNPMYTKLNAPANYTEIDVGELSYTFLMDFVTKFDTDTKDSIGFLRAASFSLLELFEKQYNTKEMQDLINGEKEFDLAIIETSFACVNAIGYKLNVPIIQITSYSTVYLVFEMFGAVTHPFIYPEFYNKRTADLSFWEKIEILGSNLMFRYLIEWELFAKQKEVLKNNFGLDPPTFKELDDALDMLFLNVNPLWDHNRPVPPNVVYLGGMHQKPYKSLPNVSSFEENTKPC